MNTFLETERMLLRELVLADAPLLFKLNADPDVVKYTGDVPFESIEMAQRFISNYMDYQLNGMGRWACIQKTDGEFLGWCGLKLTKETGEVDLGFRFMKKQWGNGFAVEASKACLHYGFGHLNLTEIIGRVQNENLASIKVLQKLEMKYSGNFIFDLHPGSKYQLLQVDFFRQLK